MWWLAFTMGLMSSFHCIGMCGPIALASPVNKTNSFTSFLSRVLYNGGRIFIYALIGLIIGWIGSSLSLLYFQQKVSVISGIIILLSLIPAFNIEKQLGGKVYPVFAYFKKPFQQLIMQKSFTSILLLGIINGLLPCGMIYMAAAGAFSSSNIWEGMTFMIFFGLGTTPMMFAISSAYQLISNPVKNRIKKILPVFVFIVGVIFIIRGLNLDVPFIGSPVMQNGAITECTTP